MVQYSVSLQISMLLVQLKTLFAPTRCHAVMSPNQQMEYAVMARVPCSWEFQSERLHPEQAAPPHHTWIPSRFGYSTGALARYLMWHVSTCADPLSTWIGIPHAQCPA